MENCDNMPMVMRRVSEHGEDLWGSTSLLVFQKSYIDCSPAKDAPMASIAFPVLISTQLLIAPLPASTHHPNKRKWRRLYKKDQHMRKPHTDNKHPQWYHCKQSGPHTTHCHNRQRHEENQISEGEQGKLHRMG